MYKLSQQIQPRVQYQLALKSAQCVQEPYFTQFQPKYEVKLPSLPYHIYTYIMRKYFSSVIFLVRDPPGVDPTAPNISSMPQLNPDLCFTATAGAEIFVCIISTILSVRLGFRAKAEVHKKNEGTFTVQILGEKDIIIHTTKEPAAVDHKYDELSEEQTDSSQSIERRTSNEVSDPEKQPLDSSGDTASVMLELQDTHM